MRNNIIGKCLLPELLNKRRWTQVDLEAATGINRKQISEYMRNVRVMSIASARIIAKELNCHIDDLYEWKE